MIPKNRNKNILKKDETRIKNLFIRVFNFNFYKQPYALTKNLCIFTFLFPYLNPGPEKKNTNRTRKRNKKTSK